MRHTDPAALTATPVPHLSANARADRDADERHDRLLADLIGDPEVIARFHADCLRSADRTLARVRAESAQRRTVRPHWFA